MPAPLDYTLQVQSPIVAAATGYQAGSAIRDDQMRQQLVDVALQQQQQQRAAVQTLMANPNPTADDYSRAMIAVPGMADTFKNSWALRNADQQQNDLSHAGQVYAALTAGKPDVATQLLKDRATAQRAAGLGKEAQAADTMASVIEQSPDLARTMVGMKLAAIPGGDKVIEGAVKLGGELRADQLQPSVLAKSQADAKKAGFDAAKAQVDAKYADQVAQMGLKLNSAQLDNISSEIGYRKESNRIALLQAQAQFANNDLKRQELGLQIQQQTQALAEKARDRVANVESGASSIDNMLNTIERIKKNPALDAVIGPLEGSPFYPHTAIGMQPGTASAEDRSDAIALIDTLGSQAFLSQIPSIKGMGSLSNAEGDKLQAALTNLSRTQSEKQFRANLDEASRLLKKGRQVISDRYGIALPAPDTPAAPGARPPLDSFNR